MALGHLDICGCGDCHAARLNDAGGTRAVQINDPHLAALLAAQRPDDDALIVEVDDQASSRTDEFDLPPHDAPPPLLEVSRSNAEDLGIPRDHVPEIPIGYVVVGAAKLANGAINALIVRDPVDLIELVVYWKRNAQTTGIGQWGVLSWPLPPGAEL